MFLSPARGLAQVTHFENEVTSSNAALTADLSSFSSTEGATLTIRNNSSSTLNFPFVWNSAAPIRLTSLSGFASMDATAASDEAFAIGVWQYVIGQTNGYCSAGTAQTFVNDPTQILYGNGFGCCSQLAMTLAALWSAAGTGPAQGSAVPRQYQTRLAVMTFHTVPEIFYGNAWHMLDPDHRVFYRNPDGSIASVAQIIANPSIVANTPDGIGWNSETMAQLYESNASSLQYQPLAYSTPADPLFTLLPMESMQLMQQNAWPTAVYQQTGAGEPPPVYLNVGEVSLERSITANAEWRNSLERFSDVQAMLQADGRMALVNSTPGTGGFTITRSGPFPIVGLELAGEFFDHDPSGSIAIQTSVDGVNWSGPTFLPLEESGSSVTKSVDLTAFVAGSNAYFVEILLNGSSAGSVGLYNMRIRMDGQMAGQMFPLLQPGQINTFVYQDLSPSSQQRSVQIDLAVPVGSRELKSLSATSLVAENPIYSVAAGYVATNLVDGDALTLAYPGSSQIDYAINLGAMSHVKQVSIWWGYFGSNPIYVNSWSLYRRATPMGPWELVQQSGFPNAPETDVATDVDATDLRLTATGNNWIGVYEFKAFGDQTGPSNASTRWTGTLEGSSAAPVQLTAASVISNVPLNFANTYPTSNLTDGNPSTLAYPGAPEVDYELDFGADTLIDSANVVWGYFGTSPLYVQNWTVLGQRDGDFGWTTLAEGGYPAASQIQVTIDRYLRRLRLRADSLNWIGVYELSVYGVPAQDVQHQAR